MPSTPVTQTTSETPSSSATDSMASATTSQTPSSSATDFMASATNSQTQLTLVSSSTPTQYDVFLSFRGEDTRLNFTGHLYQRLRDHGINTFKDDPELRSGEVISDALLDAIRNSKTYIVVFSENYATSPWCLNELGEILNCHRTMQRWVIPVFFNVDPSLVRHQTESFQKAFEKHQKRFGGEREKLENWQLTLEEVAGFSGHHVSKDRSEADVINEIVDELLLKIHPKTLDVAKYPVGLDSRVEAITTLLSSDTKGVIKFGIYGMGGVGKTTLAKALFNQLLRGGRFKGSCFLPNVREASVESLQKKLINDVLKSKNIVEVGSVEEGAKLIKDRICSAKVLVLIDDIYDLEQYESLAGPFASGSVVIITTRDEEMLEKVSVEPTYQYMLKELDYAQSYKLFTQYAFEKAKPTNNLLALCEDILGLAGGLPLALKIFGSYLSTKKEVGWKSYIETLQQYPNSTIEQKLLISLDALDDRMLKKIFIDIACFFVGWNNEKAVEVLETYYSHADEKIDTLKKRCLLTVNEEKLEMHDLLRDTGRNVARNKAPDEPGKYSRLWLPEDIEDVLKNQTGTETVEGIIPYNFDNQYVLGRKSFTTETFKWMRKLRFLYFKKVNLTGSFKQMFEDLRVLHWECCPLKCLPSDFYPQKLVILELPMSNMKTIWDLNMVSHVLGKLKTLNMSYSPDLVATPDFIRLPSLETLNLEFCKSLEEVHISIGSLERLDSLKLKGCTKLRSLPDSICNLRALKVLNISYCSSLEALPLQLGNIKSVTKLNADGLTVSKLPDSIGDLNRLVELYLSKNKNLESLPNTICNLRALEILCIDDCSNVKAMPVKLGNTESLKKLSARSLSVSKLPDSIGDLNRLVELDLSSNEKLETLPDTICNLRALEILSIDDCSNVKAMPVKLGNIESLKKLSARSLSVSKLPDSIGDLNRLVELDLSSNEKLETLPDTICNLRALEVLRINDCSNVKAMPVKLGNIESLKELSARSLSVSKLPDSIGDLNKLVKLYLSENKNLESLPNTICNLKALEVLRINNCSNVKALPVKLGNIESLKMLFPWSLSVSKLPDSIGSLTKLVGLDLHNCKNLETLPDTICNLRSLETLSIENCEKLQALPDELWKITSLRKLDASGAKLLKKLPDIGSGQIAFSLQELNLWYSGIIALPSGFSQLSNLQSLHLRECHDLLSIPKLPPNLQHLDIYSCEQLFYIPKLPPNLKRIDADRCKSLERLPNLSNLKQLEELELANCSGLTYIQGLEDLISIRSLNLRGCSGLTHRHLPKRLFKVYSEFGHHINVNISKFMDQKTDPQWLDWIIESPYWTSESSDSKLTTVYAHLLPNESHNFMGIILCFQSSFTCFQYSAKNTTSGFIWSSSVPRFYWSGSLMVIVPKSIFSVTNEDHRIELTIYDYVKFVGIHLLYKNETKTIEDDV